MFQQFMVENVSEVVNRWPIIKISLDLNSLEFLRCVR